MEPIWDLFHRLPRDIQAAVAFPSRASYNDFALPLPEEPKWTVSSSSALRQINDHVYEILTPFPKCPSIEMVFFHGLELKGSQEAHLTTWLSRDGSELWLNWLVKDFPNVRILTVSYDANFMKTNEHGRTDSYVTAENLLQCLTGAQVGQNGCPVVLVGHCLGGLIMKEVCSQANSEQSLDTSRKFRNPIQSFVENIKGLVFYASPHLGTQIADISTKFTKALLLGEVTTLNPGAARQNNEFRKLREKYGWKAFGIGENQPVTLGSFNGFIVTEASARQDMDRFYTENTHHFNVCRPESTKSSSFTMLSNFIAGVVEEHGERPRWRKLLWHSNTAQIVAGGGNLYRRDSNGAVWQHAGDEKWIRVGGNKETVEVAANAMHLYIRHESGNVWRYTGKENNWDYIDKGPANVQIVTARGYTGPSQQDLYQRHSEGSVWRYLEGGHWESLDINRVTVDIAANRTQLFQRHSDGGVFLYEGRLPWKKITEGSDRNTVQIVAEGDKLYRRCSNGKIVSWTLGHEWEIIYDNNEPGHMHVLMAADNENLYVRHSTGDLRRYEGTAGDWKNLETWHPDIVEIAAGEGKFYYRRSNGEIWQLMD